MISKVLLLTMLLIGIPVSVANSSVANSALLISCTTPSDTPPPPKSGNRG